LTTPFIDQVLALIDRVAVAHGYEVLVRGAT
jgi:hypothetical protein